MAVLNLFGGFSIEVEEGFNPFNATPKQLSQLALDLIEKYPDNFAPQCGIYGKRIYTLMLVLLIYS